MPPHGQLRPWDNLSCVSQDRRAEVAWVLSTADSKNCRMSSAQGFCLLYPRHGFGSKPLTPSSSQHLRHRPPPRLSNVPQDYLPPFLGLDTVGQVRAGQEVGWRHHTMEAACALQQQRKEVQIRASCGLCSDARYLDGRHTIRVKASAPQRFTCKMRHTQRQSECGFLSTQLLVAAREAACASLFGWKIDQAACFRRSRSAPARP